MTKYFSDKTLPGDLHKLFARSKVSLTLADLTAPDHPLIGVNQRFCKLTGYEPDACLGRNCRFLQPPEGGGPVRIRIRAFLGDPKTADAKFLIPNQRRDGSRFVNLIYMAKLTRAGKHVAILGSQFHVHATSRDTAALYDEALTQDLEDLSTIVDQNNMGLLGSFAALASSSSFLAQARMG